jgi:hypothetical protein
VGRLGQRGQRLGMLSLAEECAAATDGVQA